MQKKQRRRLEIGWVYFIRAAVVDRIKIGWTHDRPTQRLINIRSHCAVDVEPMGLIPGTRGTEQLIHVGFREVRWKNEWFNATPTLIEFIQENAISWTLADVHALPLYLSYEEWWAAEKEARNRINAWLESHSSMIG